MSIMMSLQRQLPRLHKCLSKTIPLSPVHTSSIIAQKGKEAQSQGRETQRPSLTQWKQGYHPETESAVNQQILAECKASYCYIAMACHFMQHGVALSGIAEFFNRSAKAERDHAGLMMQYQSRRGGRVELMDILKPARTEWSSAMDAMEDALGMEIAIEKILMDVHRISRKHNDVHTSSFLESHFLNEQLDSIRTLSDHITGLKVAGPGIGLIMYDKELMKQLSSTHKHSKRHMA